MTASKRNDDGLPSSSAEEIARLRQRVSELERDLSSARLGPQSYVGFTEREALLRQAERDAQMGTWIWDVSNNDVYWSPELFRILGYDPERDQASAEAFFAALHPDDLERTRSISAQAVMGGGTPATEVRVLKRSGEVRTVMLAGLALRDAEGKTVRIVGTMLDLTERRQAEQRLRKSELLLNEAQRLARLGSWTWNVDSQLIEGSDEFFDVLGLRASGPIEVPTFLNCVHPEERTRVSEHLRLLLATPREDSSGCRVIRPDGAVRRVLYSARPVLDTDAGLMGYVGTIMDVTERSQLEEQLRQAQKMEAIGRLAGGVAHDFNNLLTVILAYTEMLLKHGPSDELRAVETAAKAAADLTRRLLTFSRQAVIQPVALDLNEVVEGAIMLLSRTLGADIHLVRSLEAGLGPITADAGQAHQVLLNLAVNARDAMPNGGTLEIRTSNVSVDAEFVRAHAGCKPGAYVLLEVSDTGSGMDEHTQARIFEPFFTTKTPEKGTGLGLATVFGIVSQAGGAIEVESAIGKGTVFKLFFPREGRARPTSNHPAPRAKAESAGSVLVVEDTEQVAELVRRVLTHAGYHVFLARGFGDALGLWQEHKDEIALVLTDIVMPDGNGSELVRRVRDECPTLAIVYMSGYAPENVIGSAEPLDGLYLAKPFSANELLDKVGEALAGPRDE